MGAAPSDLAQEGTAASTRHPAGMRPDSSDPLSRQLSRLSLAQNKGEYDNLEKEGHGSDNLSSFRPISSSDEDHVDPDHLQHQHEYDHFDEDSGRGSFEEITYESDGFSDWSDAGSVSGSPSLPRSRPCSHSQSRSTSQVPSSSLPASPASALSASPSGASTPLLYQLSTIQDPQRGTTVVPCEMRVPLPVWSRICSYLYPSQLCQLSQVNRAAYEMVTGLPVWTRWYNNRLHGSARPVVKMIPGLQKSHCYMLWMCALSAQICEGCWRKCKAEKQRGHLAALPLPIHITCSSKTLALSLGSRGSDERHKELEQEGDHDSWTIQLCRPCRLAHFHQHPEPIPPPSPTSPFHKISSSSFLLKRVLRERYHIGHKEIQSIQNRGQIRTGRRKRTVAVVYSEVEALERARVAYGGDVGVQAAVSGVLSEVMGDVIQRCRLYERRRAVVEAGEIWWPYNEYLVRRDNGTLCRTV